jgi:hypothetical protein
MVSYQQVEIRKLTIVCIVTASMPTLKNILILPKIFMDLYFILGIVPGIVMEN